jgi:hypothetical protein
MARACFARQETEYSCAAAAVRHGLLLGGVHYPEQVLARWLGVTPWGTDHLSIKRFLHAQNTFHATPLVRQASEPSAAFFERLGKAFNEGAFALACIGEGGNDHWVCLGAWRDSRLWWLNSHSDYGSLFAGHTAQAFDALEWGDEVILVEPRRWAQRFREWGPHRERLLEAHNVLQTDARENGLYRSPAPRAHLQQSRECHVATRALPSAHGGLEVGSRPGPDGYEGP